MKAEGQTSVPDSLIVNGVVIPLPKQGQPVSYNASQIRAVGGLDALEKLISPYLEAVRKSQNSPVGQLFSDAEVSLMLQQLKANR